MSDEDYRIALSRIELVLNRITEVVAKASGAAAAGRTPVMVWEACILAAQEPKNSTDLASESLQACLASLNSDKSNKSAPADATGADVSQQEVAMGETATHNVKVEQEAPTGPNINLNPKQDTAQEAQNASTGVAARSGVRSLLQVRSDSRR